MGIGQNRREERRFPWCQVRRGMAEGIEAACLGAKLAIWAELGDVEIDFEDALLRQHPVDPHRQGKFEHLAEGFKRVILDRPDLTLNDASMHGDSGGLTVDNLSVEYAGVVYAIAESPVAKGQIWAGTNDGQVQLTRDGGKTWTNVSANLPGMPAWGTIANIEASRFDTGTAYLTVDGHQVNNRDPWIYRTGDYGKTWKSISGTWERSSTRIGRVFFLTCGGAGSRSFTGVLGSMVN